MQFEVIGIVALALGVVGWLLGPGCMIPVFVTSTLLGASAAIVLSDLGGANIQPAHLLLGFVALAALARSRLAAAATRSLAFPNAGFWLLLTAAYAVFSALLLPRLFAGSTYVFAIARTEIGPGIVAMPLAPASGNITQPVYFLGDVVCFLAFYAYASEPAGLRTIVRAILACAAINLLFAAIDVGAWLAGIDDALALIRNADYRMLDEATIAGFKRIVGSFPEASTFAYFTLGWFAFCARLWLAGVHARVTGPLALLSLGALLFATSSTGLAGTAGVLLALLATGIGHVLTRPAPPQMWAFATLGPVIAGIVALGLQLHQPSREMIANVIDKTVVNKLASASGIERGLWNQQAVANFSDTNSLGAGVGSVRASSFPVAVLGNIGLIGAITYGGFLFAVLFRHKNRWAEPYPAACQSAARWACFAQLLGASVAGSFIDLGLPFFIFAGLACGGPMARAARAMPRSRPRGAPRLTGVTA